MANTSYSDEYDKTDPLSIEQFSQRLIGKTFRQVIEEDESYQISVVHEGDS